MARSPSRSSRRRFMRIVGAAGLASTVLPPVLAFAQSSSTPMQRAKKPKPEPMPVQPAKPDTSATPPSEFIDDVKALQTIVERRYGKHLDAKQRAAIAKELDQRMQSGKALRAAKLVNSDEPEVTFHA